MNYCRFFAALLTIAMFCLPESGKAYDDGIRIVWDYNQCKFVCGGVYARVKKLSNNDLVLVYSSGSNVYIRTKKSGSSSWGTAVEVSRDTGGNYNYTNAELIELANGKLIYAWNARPKSNNGNPYKIMIKMSDSKGASGSWYGEQSVYLAGNTNDVGCWEPALLQLPSGEVQIYFANEATYTTNNNQEITMLRSMDNGVTWSSAICVSYRSGTRDGMPVPVYLQDDKGIVFAIEDNGINGAFKPVIIYSTVANNWQSGYVSGSSANRWHALRSDYQLNSNIYAGAPYLIQLNTGETVLSVQSGENRNNANAQDYANMQVYIGDSDAKNFSRKSTPFAYLPAAANALWSSLCQTDDSTVIAVSSINGAGSNGIWTSTGRIIQPLEIGQKISDDWGDYTSVFIGAQSPASLRMKALWDDDSLYFRFEVKDAVQTIAAEGSALWDTDGVEIYLDTKNKNANAISRDMYKFLFNINSEILASRSTSSAWENYEVNAPFQVEKNVTEYTITAAIAWSDVGGRPTNAFGAHIKLHNNDNGTIVHEDLSGSNPDRSRTWIKTTLLQYTNLKQTAAVGEKLSISPSVVKKGESFVVRLPAEIGKQGYNTVGIYHLTTGACLYKQAGAGEQFVIENFPFAGVFLVVAIMENGKQLVGKVVSG